MERRNIIDKNRVLCWMRNTAVVCSLILVSSLAIGQSTPELELLVKQADSSYAFKKWGGEDYSINAQEYRTARKYYLWVLDSYPDNDYSKNRVAEIDRILLSFETKPIYDGMRKRADSLFIIGDYSSAQRVYLKSDSILNYLSNQYDRVKLTERMNVCSDALMIDSPSKAKEFVDLVQEGDSLFLQYWIDQERDAYNSSALKNAQESYRKAILIYDGSRYVQDKINRTEEVELKFTGTYFDKFSDSALSDFNDGKYDNALRKYEYLMLIIPENAQIVEMIEKCKSKLE